MALDLVSAPASQIYNEHIFSISSDITGGQRNRTQASLSAECFEVKLELAEDKAEAKCWSMTLNYNQKNRINFYRTAWNADAL